MSEFVGKMAAVLTAEQAPYVAMETSAGPLVLELYWKYAPKACAVGAPPCCFLRSGASVPRCLLASCSSRGIPVGRVRASRAPPRVSMRAMH